MNAERLESLRVELEGVNHELLALFNRRAELVTEAQDYKSGLGADSFDPMRQQEMLAGLIRSNQGPFSDETIKRLFSEVFRASLGVMDEHRESALRVSRSRREEDLIIQTPKAVIGKENVLIAGPCSVESEEQMDQVGRMLSSWGVTLLRGGAFKPRSSPYSFQGLGERGLKILRETADRYGLSVVSEVMDTRRVELVARYVDVLQIGARNMQNFDLLKAVGKIGKPVLLKRGLCATLDELLHSAEYIIDSGNEEIILCERGIRTYERQTRNTLDISAVPLLRQMSYLPVVVDVTHAAGRKDILAPLGRAALAAGANGLMVEMHPCPSLARSDCQQQFDFDEFLQFVREIGLPTPLRAVASGKESR
jgi:3-deoxy-7-phosphoheptulonate synthase / chorismate mutase